jgi:hypothetical protein
MPSIAVAENGNMAIGYSTSSIGIFPSIPYAVHLDADPLNNLAQGEAIMTNGGGAQTSPLGGCGDYSMTTQFRRRFKSPRFGGVNRLANSRKFPNIPRSTNRARLHPDRIQFELFDPGLMSGTDSFRRATWESF